MWPPQFFYAPSIQGAAVAINWPHDDYPRRVNATAEAIATLMERRPSEVDGALLREVHSIIMADLPDRGRFRKHDLHGGNYLIPPWTTVPERLSQFLPAIFANQKDLENFYVGLAEIHPFSSGNGRCIGAIIAAMSGVLGLGGFLVSIP